MPRPKKEQPNHAGGLYEVKITIGKTLDGKLLRKSFYSSISKDDARRQAEEWKIQREVANRTGSNFINKDVTFEEWAMRWAETYKKPNVDENTYISTYLNTLNNHLIPYFGKASLKDIRPIDVQKFLTEKSNYSESLLSKLKMILHAIFDAAIDNDLCYKNPAKSVTYTSDRAKNEKKVYTDEQIQIVESFAADRMPEVIILLETGLRRGELLGLKWEDVDLHNKTLSVRRSVANKSGGGVTVNPPKWNSYRTNPLSARAIAVFKTLPRTSEYIFPSSANDAQRPDSWALRLRKFMIELAKNHKDIPQLTAHELRHTYGTRLRRNGADIYSIQKVMGHKDIRMTTEIYVHNEIETLRKAIANSL